MKAPYVEGVAIHDDPESCSGAREGVVEALTGARTGWVLSREIRHFGTPTPLTEAEGNTDGAESARSSPVPRGRRPHCMFGTSLRENREISRAHTLMVTWAASGRPWAVSRR